MNGNGTRTLLRRSEGTAMRSEEDSAWSNVMAMAREWPGDASQLELELRVGRLDAEGVFSPVLSRGDAELAFASFRSSVVPEGFRGCGSIRAICPSVDRNVDTVDRVWRTADGLSMRQTTTTTRGPDGARAVATRTISKNKLWHTDLPCVACDGRRGPFVLRVSLASEVEVEGAEPPGTGGGLIRRKRRSTIRLYSGDRIDVTIVRQRDVVADGGDGKEKKRAGEEGGGDAHYELEFEFQALSSKASLSPWSNRFVGTVRVLRDALATPSAI